MTSLLLILSLPAGATWSIVAADPATGQVGGAGTSCVGDLDVSVIYASAPGVGAVHAQARLNFTGRDEAARLLADNTPPEAIIARITQPDFDGIASRRQYGVVDLQGRSAAWTGRDNGDWAGDRQGSADGFIYSAQGNILTGEAVVTRTAEAFEASAACDLPERLLEALTAGRAAGEGDSRCTDRGIPADSAFVRVQEADGTDLISLSVSGTGGADPLDTLRGQLDAWREDNPCPDPPESEEDTDPDTDASEAAAGCACMTTPSGPNLLALGLLAMVGLRRRPVR